MVAMHEHAMTGRQPFVDKTERLVEYASWYFNGNHSVYEVEHQAIASPGGQVLRMLSCGIPSIIPHGLTMIGLLCRVDYVPAYLMPEPVFVVLLGADEYPWVDFDHLSNLAC